MTTHNFDAVVQTEGPGTFVEVPLDVPALFGRKRPPVVVTVNDFSFRTTVAVYGGRYFLPLNKSVRDGAGIAPGDELGVTIELDDAPREVDIPAELAAALDVDEPARAAFDALSFTHRREHAEYVAEAKRAETRRRRALKTIEDLKSHRR
jgi:hypothetical protein